MNREKVLIFGTGGTAMRIFDDVRKKAEVIGFLDNDSTKWGTYINDIPVLGNGSSIEQEYDVIFISSNTSMNILKEQLMGYGIAEHKISCEYVSTYVNARLNFLRDFSALQDDLPSEWNVAEAGVYQGEFSKEINKCFPNQMLYLFDTFEGFDSRDVEVERRDKLSTLETAHFNGTSVELVTKKLPYPEKAIIRKGYFPETSVGLEELNFFFVNLDFDLYSPTLSGLRFFYPRIVKGGVLLIHDYYSADLAGVKKAIDDFEMEQGIKLIRLPIGDHLSIAIIKA